MATKGDKYSDTITDKNGMSKNCKHNVSGNTPEGKVQPSLDSTNEICIKSSPSPDLPESEKTSQQAEDACSTNSLSFVDEKMKKKIQRAYDYSRGSSEGLSGVEVFQAMQCCGLHPTQNDKKEIIKMVADQHAGCMSYDAFESFISKDINSKLQYEKQVLRDSFAKFDINGDGFVSLNELKSVLCAVGDVLMEEEYEGYFRMFDKNQDGRLDIDEFVELMYNLDEDDFMGM